jgi:HlyD family secretion protein
VSNVTYFTVEQSVPQLPDVVFNPGMTTDVEILTKEKTDVLVLPVEAVQESGDGFYVLMDRVKYPKDKRPGSGNPTKPGTKAGGAAKPAAPGAGAPAPAAATPKGAESPTRKVYIKLGIQTSKEVEVLEGLQDGDEVLLPSAKGGAGGANSSQNQLNKAAQMGTKAMSGK